MKDKKDIVNESGKVREIKIQKVKERRKRERQEDGGNNEGNK